MSVFVAKCLLEKFSPVLSNLKPSILIMFENRDLHQIFNVDTLWNLSLKGIEIHFLGSCKTKSRILLYNREKVKETLQIPANQKLLTSFGYTPNLKLEQILDKLEDKFLSVTKDSFPHEIGIFLGYPAEDVVGFIKNKGKNYKICGTWKVYNNTAKALKTFSSFKQCRKTNLELLHNGVLFQDIVKGANIQ